MRGSEVRFLLLCEGSSDDGLVAPLRDLLVEHGAGMASGTADHGKGSVAEKLRACGEWRRDADLVFVHRDADSAGDGARRQEISGAAANDPRVIPVIPVRMTESWLLADEPAIRRVVGCPGRSDDLGLPPGKRVEDVTDPKRLLAEALLAASGATGRRRRAQSKRFSDHRRILLEQLNIHGPVSRLASWQRLVEDIDRVMENPTGDGLGGASPR